MISVTLKGLVRLPEGDGTERKMEGVMVEVYRTLPFNGSQDTVYQHTLGLCLIITDLADIL